MHSIMILAVTFGGENLVNQYCKFYQVSLQVLAPYICIQVHLEPINLKVLTPQSYVNVD